MQQGPDDARLDAVASQVGDALHARHAMLTTAESCTGGWVAKILTDIPGSSAWFDRGFVTYTNQSKQDMLGVGADMLAQHGAVSEGVVDAMARGALQASQARFSLAITGIAGPGGATSDKPVGLVWFGWGRQTNGQSLIRTARHLFVGDRDAVRRQAVQTALTGVLDDLAAG
ncbi:MAG: nicotinamide-nucleotide amidase [Proteobacteria bacterium]|jgi:nicotinamide-nucleotide amidase|nr:nicotinamide-nucleotide amidase [Pseudomonadota bacterium]MCG6935521.1 nicotinamide-nucleotide amidase [Pseudomonadota bacterium]